MAADSKAAAESAPFVEQLVKRDYEVGTPWRFWPLAPAHVQKRFVAVS
jgi:hypothetical protein